MRIIPIIITSIGMLTSCQTATIPSACCCSNSWVNYEDTDVMVPAETPVLLNEETLESMLAQFPVELERYRRYCAYLTPEGFIDLVPQVEKTAQGAEFKKEGKSWKFVDVVEVIWWED